MKYLMLAVVLLGCNDKQNTVKRQLPDQDAKRLNTDVTIPNKSELLGVWTDGSGFNASFRIDEDSVYNVEHFTMRASSHTHHILNLSLYKPATKAMSYCFINYF